ncbi:hypothetical protein MTO96_042373, partial [Rhipicephalus appendiculatus]
PPKAAIKFTVVNGFWLTVAIFILRCAESLALACDDNDHVKQSSNVHAWIQVSCIDSSASQPVYSDDAVTVPLWLQHGDGFKRRKRTTLGPELGSAFPVEAHRKIPFGDTAEA